jgi:hypothetical protein
MTTKNSNKSLSRRKFLQVTAVGLGTAATVGLLGACSTPTAPVGNDQAAVNDDALVAQMKLRALPTCPFCGELV